MIDTEIESPEQTMGELSRTAQLIAAAIRAQAGWRGWDQRDIARETGLKPAYISLRWRAERAWSFDDTERIARAMNMDVWEFLRAAEKLSRISIAVRPADAQPDEDQEEDHGEDQGAPVIDHPTGFPRRPRTLP